MHGLEKLKPDQVQAIRTHCRAYGWGSQTRMAKRFHVTKETISQLMQGNTYRDVPEDELSLNAAEIRELMEALDEYEAAERGTG